MDLQIRGNDVPIPTELRAFATQRIEKLDRLIDRVVDANLELRKQHHRSGADTVTAQLTIRTRKHLLRAEEHDIDPRRAIDLAVDKMNRQVRRFHDKRTDRKGARWTAPVLGEPTVDGGGELDGDEIEDENSSAAKPVRVKRFRAKPMDPDEAIQQMELLAHDFFLFFNADGQEVNVVYRRRDGSYGLLVPERS